MNAWQAMLLGLVQGLCEFLPVSSSGHLVLFQTILGIDDPGILLDTLLHVGTLIAIYSPTKVRAMLNVLPFCLGMLLTYYAMAMLTHGAYGRSFIIGWTVFAFFSPIMAYFAWMVKQRGLFPKIIGTGIVLVSILSSVLLFDRLRIYDLVIDGLLVYFIFFKRIDRHEP